MKVSIKRKTFWLILCIVLVYAILIRQVGISDGNKVFESLNRRETVALGYVNYHIDDYHTVKVLDKEKTQLLYDKLKQNLTGVLIRTHGNPGEQHYVKDSIRIMGTVLNRIPEATNPFFYIQKEFGLTVLYIPNVGKYILFNHAYEDILDVLKN